MRFPLSVKKICGYKFRSPTSYPTPSGHLGVDYCATYQNLYAPCDGKAVSNPFATGGNVIDFYCNPYGTPLVMRFMHLREIIKTGQVSEGEVIAVTGNTGTLSTAPHLHLDISKNKVNIKDINNFIDPEVFQWSGGSMKKQRTFFQSGTAVLMHLLPEDLTSYEANDGIYHPIIRGTYFNEDKKEVLTTIAEPKFLDVSQVSPTEVLPSIVELQKQITSNNCDEVIKPLKDKIDTLEIQLELSGKTIDGKEEELKQLVIEQTKKEQGWLVTEGVFQDEINVLADKLDIATKKLAKYGEGVELNWWQKIIIKFL